MREPNNPAALIARGDAHYFLGKFEHALVDYHRARSQDNLLTKADQCKYFARPNQNNVN